MFSTVWDVASALISKFNEKSSTQSPAMIVTVTLVTTLLLQKGYQLYLDWDTKQIKEDFTEKTIKALEYTPYYGRKITAKINSEVEGILSGIQRDVDEQRKIYKIFYKLPENGLSILTILDRFKSLQKNYRPGKLSGAVYADFNNELLQLLKNIWAQTALTNPMHSDWPLINLMEAEVIAMCQDLLNNEYGAPGIITHGGTTSILEACKAYVLHARKIGITSPEIIVPSSAHSAFRKAAIILNAKLVTVPTNAETGEADVFAMKKYINKHTCLIVGSAPSFPFGIIDPITALGELALEYNLPLHVDACLGGFITIFANKSTYQLPACDFSVPGVTSISLDTHKYAKTTKGNSILVFRKNLPYSTTYVDLSWQGGMYVTPGIDGSRSGADIATTWTVLCYTGKQQYIKDTNDILELAQTLKLIIRQMDDVYIPYNPLLSVIPIQCRNGINSLLVAEQLKCSGWSVNILQTPEQQTAGFHFCLTSVHVHHADFLVSFTTDLKAAVQYAKDHPNEQPKSLAKAYGKLKSGVPFFVQERIGRGYANIIGTLPSIVKGSRI